ncbi:NADP-dependent oxidoreductase [Streptomyces sp. t39]|uniref:NADP-dependent oxidoreductase n=1 Tax=Streptomyces sp. t39 TaxID=1828156 RepID=UPI0011CDC5AE|nr:NADP-dependent oxidoreductase [Streptomyces sp. t39]TXS56074.1 NADP-dependent oxidoreductase [Streptomyces sp. t39]
MRAVTVSARGAEPELVQLPKPEPGEGEIVVKVEYAALNPADWQTAGAVEPPADWQTAGAVEPPADGPTAPPAFPRVIGTDFAGRVDVVGPGDNRFRVGDAVFGLAVRPVHAGSYAEYVSVHQDGPVALVPEGLALRSAAVLPTAGTTADQILAAVRVPPGGTLLVVGAAGGVGSCLTRLAAARGVEVVAVVRGDERKRMGDLGAGITVDATTGSVTDAVRRACPEGVDGVADLVSDTEDGFARYAAHARPGSVAVATRRGAGLRALPGGVQSVAFRMKPTAAQLEALAAAAADGGLDMPFDAELPLEKAPDALAQNRAGGARGKTVFVLRGV